MPGTVTARKNGSIGSSRFTGGSHADLFKLRRVGLDTTIVAIGRSSWIGSAMVRHKKFIRMQRSFSVYNRLRMCRRRS